MFVVSPRASTSLLAPPPISPITTGPVWMPIGCGEREGVRLGLRLGSSSPNP